MRIAIDSLTATAEHPLLAAFASLRDKDLRGGTEGAFIVEGEVVLRVLLRQSRYAIRAIFLSQPQWVRLQSALPPGVPCYVAPLSLMQEIVGFPIHRGVLALAARGQATDATTLVGSMGPQIVLGLCGITNHDNVGGMFRNAAAFAASAVLLDRASCDPLYRKSVRVSVGGALLVPHAYVPSEDQLVDTLHNAGHTLVALSPRGDRSIGRDPPPPADRVALLLGAEGPGLSARTLSRCISARIPMAAGWDSLNVSVASGIALAWLRAGRDINAP